MNPALFAGFFTPKIELRLILPAVFLTIILLPALAVLVVTRTGTDLVSDHLVNLNEQDYTVEILSPLDGSVVKIYTAVFTWPTKGIITLNFGETSIYQPLHTGIDIAKSTGTPVTPFMKGKVIYTGQKLWGYGKHVIIDHGDNLSSYYAHLDQILVEEGQEVTPADLIGTQGETGWSTGPHLHFEIRVYGIPVNPLIFLR